MFRIKLGAAGVDIDFEYDVEAEHGIGSRELDAKSLAADGAISCFK